jgi:hypothetical protein
MLAAIIEKVTPETLFPNPIWLPAAASDAGIEAMQAESRRLGPGHLYTSGP